MSLTERLAAGGLALTLAPCLAFAQTSTPGERDRVFAEYATLKTVAGLAEEEDDNFWRPEFEGADARTIELSNPHMTMADVMGNYYIADKESHSVLRVDTEGRVHTHAGTHVAGYNGDEGLAVSVQLNNPNGLYVHPDGTVFILDLFNQRICKVDPDGNLTTILHDPEGFGPGRGLWVRRDERLIYYNGGNRVKRWTSDGGIETVVESISDPGNLTVDSGGALVVTSRGDHRVYRVGGDGGLTVIAGDGSDTESGLDGVPATEVGLEDVRGIAFLPHGGFFVATQKGGDVWYVDPPGLIHRFLSGTPSGNVIAGDGELFSTPGDKISEPRAVSVAPNGDLIITTNDRGIIRVVERFQTPKIHWMRSAARVYVTAGRPHTVEMSEDLRSWEVWRILDSESTGTELPAEGLKRFFRVGW